ncbi:alpha-L-rhamnosidase-related protein [Paenibacillus albus]|nr:glycosyl hydrolase family 65 protein [Paenibacillus albus]
MSKTTSLFTLQSSDKRLEEAVSWAKEQALAYASDSDPVGPWYEAALPGREAFCMRDVAHMSTGAAALGLSAHTKNMLLKFAENISESKDWCTFWEITREGLPCPDDYASDDNFWYNLPANFDIIACCFRMHLWSRDKNYLNDERLLSFYEKSLNEYVRRWDRDGDGIPDHVRGEGRRGIASYVEDALTPKVGGDLVAAQYAAYAAYSEMAKLMGWPEKAEHYARLAERLQKTYEEEWWSEKDGRFSAAILQDGSYHSEYYLSAQYLPIYFGLIATEAKRRAAVNDIKRNGVSNIEEMSHLPDVYYAVGEKEEAYRIMLQLCDKQMKRREYPEVSYSVIGNVVTGLLGIKPCADQAALEIAPQLPEGLEWVSVGGVAVLDNWIDVEVRDGHVNVRNAQGPSIRVRSGGVEQLLAEGETSSFDIRM